MNTLAFLESLKNLKWYILRLPEEYSDIGIVEDETPNTSRILVENWDNKYVRVERGNDGHTLVLVPSDVDGRKFIDDAKRYNQKKFQDELAKMIKMYSDPKERDDLLNRNIIKMLRTYLREQKVDTYLNEYMQIVQIGCLKAQNLKF